MEKGEDICRSYEAQIIYMMIEESLSKAPPESQKPKAKSRKKMKAH